MLLFIATRPFYIRYQQDMWKVTGLPSRVCQKCVCVCVRETMKERANPNTRTDGVCEIECDQERERERGNRKKKRQEEIIKLARKRNWRCRIEQHPAAC